MLLKIYHLISVFFVCCLIVSCGKDKVKYEEVRFEFTIPLSFTPVTDTIVVGQSLNLKANFSDSLYDLISQKKYYLPNFDFKTVAVILKLTNPAASITEQPGAVNNFGYNYFKGNFSNFSSRFADVNYIYEAGYYNLDLQIKALEAGVYSILFYHSTGSKGQTELPSTLAPSEPGIKRIPYMQVLRYNFNGGNTHFNIYKNNCKPNYRQL